MVRRLCAALIALAFVLIPAVPAAAQSGPPIGTVNNPTLGTIFVDHNGMTLYYVSTDQSGVSNCYGPCAAVWPPAYIDPTSALLNQTGGMPGITTIRRSDGTFQLAWNGMPLYGYSRDRAPGDVNGNGITDPFGTWHVASPNGTTSSSGGTNTYTTTSSSGGTSTYTTTGGGPVAPTGGGSSETSGAAGSASVILTVDAPKPGTQVTANQDLDIGGWSSGNSVTVNLDSSTGQMLGTAPVNKPRPDVPQVTGRADLANSGFDVVWHVAGVSNGNHTLYVTATGSGAPTTDQVPIVIIGAGTSSYYNQSYGYQPNYYQYSGFQPGFSNSYGYGGYGGIGGYGGMGGYGYPALCNPSYPIYNYLYANSTVPNVPCSYVYNNPINQYGYYPQIPPVYTGITPPPPYTTPYTYPYGSGGSCDPYYPNVTAGYPYIPCSSVTTLTAPTGVMATQPIVGTGTVNLTWTAVPGAAAYTVSLVSPTTSTILTSGTNTATITGLALGQTYTFSVTATAAGAVSTPGTSNPVTLH